MLYKYILIAFIVGITAAGPCSAQVQFIQPNGQLGISGVATSLPTGIIGEDDRTAYKPFQQNGATLRKIGLLSVQQAGVTKAGQCSGALISSRLVLTAAHCFYSPSWDAVRSRGGAPLKVTFILRYDGTTPKPGQIFRGVRIETANQWFPDRTAADGLIDLAVVALDRSTGEYGLNFGALPQLAVTRPPAIKIIGYPGSGNGRLFVAETRDYKLGNGFIQHQGDMEKGQSGGPVLYHNQIVGVHSYVTRGSNASTLLTPELVRKLRRLAYQY